MYGTAVSDIFSLSSSVTSYKLSYQSCLCHYIADTEALYTQETRLTVLFSNFSLAHTTLKILKIHSREVKLVNTIQITTGGRGDC